MVIKNFTGPIPGENYTSDTRNYPWHRPPEFTNIDKAIEAIGKKLMSESSAPGILTMLELGMPVSTITDAFLTSGIGAGKWTPDFALLLAGPTSHIICLMAEGYGIDYDLGIEDTRPRPTSAFFKTVEKEQQAANIIKKRIPVVSVGQPEAPVPQGGFMGGAPAPQQSMPEANMSEEI